MFRTLIFDWTDEVLAAGLFLQWVCFDASENPRVCLSVNTRRICGVFPREQLSTANTVYTQMLHLLKQTGVHAALMYGKNVGMMVDV